MLLAIAFACFIILFAAWLFAPSSPSGIAQELETSPMSPMPDAGTSPA